MIDLIHYLLLAAVGILAGWKAGDAVSDQDWLQLALIGAAWFAAVVLITVLFP